MRDCGKHSGAISSVIVTSTGATMVHAHGQLLGISYDLKHKQILIVLFLFSSFNDAVTNSWQGEMSKQ
jgi:hypothetical protein